MKLTDDEKKVRAMLQELAFYRTALVALTLEQPTKSLVIPKDRLTEASRAEVVRDEGYSIDFIRLQVRSQGKIVTPEQEGV